MTILLLTHSYPDTNIKWRGVFIQEQVKALSIRHEIIVVYFKTDYSHLRPFAEYTFEKRETGRITEYKLTMGKSFPIINQLKYLSDTFRFIKREILSKKKIDIIHSHLSYPGGFLGTIIQKKEKIPNILTEHSWIKKYFRSPVHRICVLYALKHSSSVISVSNALKQDINSYCERQISVIPNVIPSENFSISYKSKTGILNIGILGGMGTYRKGLDILLNAVSLLKGLELSVHIGGDGKYLNVFKKMAVDLGVAERCTFYGEIERDRIKDFFSKLDIYVLPSRDETFGVVVVEAMASGLPVIATKCGGPEEIITPATGVLVERENPGDLARAIRIISGNLGSYDREEIRRYASEKYGTAAFVESMSVLYQDVVSRAKKFEP